MTDKEINDAANNSAGESFYPYNHKKGFIAGAKCAIGKSDAIEFGEWIREQPKSDEHATAELYELFKESKNKA